MPQYHPSHPKAYCYYVDPKARYNLKQCFVCEQYFETNIATEILQLCESYIYCLDCYNQMLEDVEKYDGYESDDDTESSKDSNYKSPRDLCSHEYVYINDDGDSVHEYESDCSCYSGN